MHSAQQSITSAEDRSRAGIDGSPGDSVSPQLRPLLRFLRRPDFAPSALGRLSVRYWLAWLGLLLLLAVLSGMLDRILVRAFHWPVPVPGAWAAFLRHPSRAAANPAGPLHGLVPMFVAMATLLAVMGYGVMALGRVVRLRW